MSVGIPNTVRPSHMTISDSGAFGSDQRALGQAKSVTSAGGTSIYSTKPSPSQPEPTSESACSPFPAPYYRGCEREWSTAIQMHTCFREQRMNPHPCCGHCVAACAATPTFAASSAATGLASVSSAAAPRTHQPHLPSVALVPQPKTCPTQATALPAHWNPGHNGEPALAPSLVSASSTAYSSLSRRETTHPHNH